MSFTSWLFEHKSLDFANQIDLLYVGHSTTRKLSRLAIETIGQLANANLEFITSHLGKWGVVLHRFANGLDQSPVAHKGEEAFIKSVGNSTTLPRDVTTVEDVKKVFYMLSESVSARLREHGLKANTVQIYVRDNELQSCERQARLRYASYLTSEFAEKALEIYLKKYVYRRPIRSLGVRGCNLVPQNVTVQLDLFEDHVKRDRMESFERSVDDMRRRFGYHIIQRGIIFEDRKLTGINPKDEHVIHPINFFDGALDYTLKGTG